MLILTAITGIGGAFAFLWGFDLLLRAIGRRSLRGALGGFALLAIGLFAACVSAEIGGAA